MTKDDLINAAEATHLSDKPIRPAPAPRGRDGWQQRNPASYYSGWSGMTKKLLCNDPPYVCKGGRPVKYTLTPEVSCYSVRWLTTMLIYNGEENTDAHS